MNYMAITMNDFQRLFFLVQEEPICDQIEASLVELGVDENRVFIYDELSEDFVALPEQSAWDRNRRIPMFIWGFLLGGLAGFLSAYFRSFADDQIPQNLIILVIIVGAVLGAAMFHIAAGDEHDKRLQEFQDSVFQKGLLLVTDVPRKHYRRIHQQIIARHPAKYLGSIDRTKNQ